MKKFSIKISTGNDENYADEFLKKKTKMTLFFFVYY